jgi:superfamily II DNA or RNA helicase
VIDSSRRLRQPSGDVVSKLLLDAVKKAALPAVFSQGVKLARDGAVLAERQGESEGVFRVRDPGRAAYLTVTLYFGDPEWTCDCMGLTDPCSHAVAAAIAVHHAAERGEVVPAAAQTGAQLKYVFRRLPHGNLAVERYAVVGEQSARIDGTLARAQAQYGLQPGPRDLVADRIITAAGREPLRAAIWPAMLDALTGAQIELDGKTMRAVVEPVVPVARVFDQGADVVFTIDKSRDLDEVVTYGLGRVGDTLRPLGLLDVTGTRGERLPLTRRFSRAELGELAAKVLPDIESCLAVSIESERLPRRAKRATLPRISFEIDNDVHALSVLPLLVYGDPPEARVDAGELVHLRGDAPVRDLPAERRLVERLRDELNLVFGRRVDFDGHDANRFAARLRDFQSRSGVITASHLVRSAPLEPHVRIDGDALHAEFLVPAAEGEERGPAGRTPATAGASALAVLRAWQDGLSLVPLDAGGWAPLPLDWLAQHGHRLADLLAARDEQGRLPRVAIPALSALADQLEQPRPASWAALEPLLRDFQAVPQAALPADLTATLRSYQRAGVDWLCFLRDAGLGALLADDMGLGKTVQTLCAVRGRTLIVAPKSVVHNWQSEAERFRPALRTSLYQGPKREIDAAADVTITSYAILRLDGERLAHESWDTVVLDEAQAIKNPDSQVARAAYALTGKFLVALTGTPLENRLEELWSILYFSHRGLLPGRSEFRDRYAVPIEQGDRERLAALRQKTKPFILRRLKRDVLPELPPRTDMILEVELDPSEREVYTAVRAATLRDVVAKLQEGGSVLLALEALLRLRQAACHPALVPGQTAPTSSKIEALLENLEEVAAEGHKALVFSQWTSFLDLVEPHLEAKNLGYDRLDGSTVDRGSVVARFQSENGPPVLLTSLKAGGTGLNLTAADHVFLLDPWWNPAVEDQAADRAHRIGQERPVMVYRLIAKDTVEEGILALQAKKRGLAEAALEGAAAASAITREALLTLLGG